MDTVKEIYCSNNQIFLICESDSKTQDFSFHLNDNRAICVILLDEQNLMIKNKICIENNQNNNYLDSSYYDQTLSLLVNLNGNNGQYENNGSYNGTIIININQLLNVNNYFFIPDYNKKYLEMVSDSRQIYLFYQSYIDDTFYLSIYENAGLELETNDKITNIKACVTKSEGVYYSLVKYKDNNYYIDNIYSINSSSILPYSLGTTINDPKLNIISILETNDEISIIIKKNDCLEITNLKVFNFEKHNKQNEQYNNTFYFVTLDGKSLSKEYLSTTPSFDTFGKKGYFVKYILDDYTTLVVKEVYDVFLNVNVKENEIYDIGLKLSFNGIGYLNQEEITSGYIINNPGSYSLHLIGNNNEEYTINFSVKKITIPDNEREENNLELQEQEKKVEHKKQETSIQNTVLPYEEKTNVTGIIILLALIIISSISAFFYYRKEKKK